MLGPHFPQGFAANLDFTLDEEWMRQQSYNVSTEEIQPRSWTYCLRRVTWTTKYVKFFFLSPSANHSLISSRNRCSTARSRIRSSAVKWSIQRWLCGFLRSTRGLPKILSSRVRLNVVSEQWVIMCSAEKSPQEMFIPNHDFGQMNAHLFRTSLLYTLSAKITIREFWQQTSLLSQYSALNLGTRNCQLRRFDTLISWTDTL